MLLISSFFAVRNIGIRIIDFSLMYNNDDDNDDINGVFSVR